MNKLKYMNYFFILMLTLSLVFTVYVIVDAESVNAAISGKSNLVIIWLFVLASAFVVKEILDYWFVNRSKNNLLKVIIEGLGIIYFSYILLEAI